MCVPLVIGLAAMYAPQITAFAGSLMTPLGQATATYVAQDVQAGNYGMAVMGIGVKAGAIRSATQSGLRVGDSFGKLGTVAENTSQKITGYTSHGLDQKISRSVPTNQLLEASRNPLVTLQQARDTTLRITKDVGVVLNQAGKVVTTYTKDQFLPHIKNVINRVTK